MSGTAVIAKLLAADAAILAVIPVGQIKQGRITEGTPLPVLLLRTVSVVDRQPLKRGARVRSVERVAATVRAKTYREQVTIMRLARAACAGKVGDFAGVLRAAVLTAGLGPDVDGPGNSFEQTQDFRVSYDA